MANADTHGRERAARSRFLQLMNGGENETGAAHAEWVAERDGSAVGIRVCSVICQTQLAQTGKRLAGESLI